MSNKLVASLANKTNKTNIRKRFRAPNLCRCSAAAALNQWYEADIDALMKRTRNRPLPAGRMDRDSALHFGVGLGAFSVLLMGLATNWVAAAVLACEARRQR